LCINSKKRVFSMKKISVLKVQKLKTTAVAAYPIWVCWPF